MVTDDTGFKYCVACGDSSANLFYSKPEAGKDIECVSSCPHTHYGYYYVQETSESAKVYYCVKCD